jgi:hypothetical protein
MNKRIWSILICVGFMVHPSARGTTGSWDQVENLAPGTPISVLERHRIHCQFESATDDELACRSDSRISLLFTIPRSQIAQVTLDMSDSNHVAAGALIGGGIGAALGALRSGDPHARGAAALFGGGLGALFGGSFGKAIPAKRGPILYEP